MTFGFRILKNQYFDSVFLMRVNRRLSDEAGITDSAVLTGSESNRKLLAELKLYDAQMDGASANDLIVALQAESDAALESALAKLPEFLKGGEGTPSEVRYRTLEEGLEEKPAANLAVISIPGEFAAREARKALEHGLNVFLFSDNVNIDDELSLKTFASERHLLVMGPDCGTSILGGTGIGFANAVRKGTIGAIGPSGTGLQEFTSLVHQAGYGISHAIGTGSHDLSDAIGGITSLSGLDLLESDASTSTIAFISKPPGSRTLEKLVKRLRACSKPVITCFLGVPPGGQDVLGQYESCETIDGAVNIAIRLTGGQTPETGQEIPVATTGSTSGSLSYSAPQKYLRGLFAGGTFCYQTQHIFRSRGYELFSNAPLDKKMLVAHPTRSQENCVIDMGDDYFTQGKPHPMIDGTERRKRILEEARDPELKVLLLDFVLGYNASKDPAGELADAIREAREMVETRKGYLPVVTSICGTDLDPQDLKLQTQILQEAGAVVFQSNARAAQYSLELLGRG
jgi:FdrA protein